MQIGTKDTFGYDINQGSKSNVLKPLIVMILILLPSMTGLFLAGQQILGICVAVALSITFATFIIIYLISYFKNPNLLRSEKYNITQQYIEKLSVQGDSQLPQPDNRISQVPVQIKHIDLTASGREEESKK